MPTQTGSIDFTSTGGFKSYATNKYAAQSTVSQMQTAISQNAANIALRATKTEAEAYGRLTATLLEGDVAAATDAAKTPMAALALYGRSTQDGTPTPSAPVPIVSVTPQMLPDHPQRMDTGKGITFTDNGDGSYGISGTATANAYIYLTDNSSNFKLPAGTYTLSVRDGNGANVAGVRAGASRWVNGANTTYGIAVGAKTFTHTGEGNVQLIVEVMSGTTVNATIWPCLYAGSTAYPYVPYGYAGLWAKRTSDASTYTVTPIPLDGHELRSLPDGTRDEVTVDERGHAVLVQRVVALTFDGSSDEGWRSYAYNHGTGFYISTALFANPSTNKQRLEWVMCDSFETVTSNATMTAGTFYLGGGTATSSLNFLHGSVTTLDAWRAWLAENPVTVIGLLATPVIHDLGYVDAVPLVGPDLTAQTVPTAPFTLTYWKENAQLAINRSYEMQAELKVQSDRIGMVVSNEDASSSLALTADAMEYIGDHVEIKGADGTSTVISGGKVRANSIGADEINATSINASKTLTVGAMTDAAASMILNSNVPQYRIFTTTYSYTLSRWLTYATEGAQDSWTQVKPVNVGDTVLIKGTNKDTGDPVYLLATVDTVGSSSQITKATSHGLIDPTAGQRADSIQVGGRNLLKASDALVKPTSYYAYDIYVAEAIESGQPYVLQLWDVDVSHSAKTAAQLGVNVYYCGGSVALGGWIGTNYFTSGHADHLTLYFTAYTSGSTVNSGGNISGSANVLSHSTVTNATKKYIRLYNSVPTAEGTRNMSVGSWKLEKGNKATDWTPAPEDITVEKYITSIDDNGIRVHAKSNTTTNYAAIDADGLDVVKGGVSVAQFGKTSGTGPSARIGKEASTHVTISASEESGTGYTDSTSDMTLYDATGNSPDLRLYNTSRAWSDDSDGSEEVGIALGRDVYASKIRASIYEGEDPSSNLEILTGDLSTSVNAGTFIGSQRHWASDSSKFDKASVQTTSGAGGGASVQISAMSGNPNAAGAYAGMSVEATSSGTTVTIEADEVKLYDHQQDSYSSVYITHGMFGQTTETSANSYKDFTVTFGHEYTSAPHVVVGFYSTSTAAALGGMSCAVHSITNTGCKVRVFNNTSSARSPGFEWIAIG